MTRIRYTVLENGSLVSKNPVTYNDTTYAVTILPDFTWTINYGEQVLSGSEANLVYAKKAVRFAFLTLGVNLGSETRTRAPKLDIAAKVV